MGFAWSLSRGQLLCTANATRDGLMKSVTATSLGAALLLALSPPTSVTAQELRAIEVHLQALQTDSIGTLRYVARRCAGLFTVLADVSETSSPEVSRSFSEGVPAFIAMAVRAEQRLGSAEAQALESTELAIRDIMPLYQRRMRVNMASSGSYIADDGLLRSDVQVCRAIISPG